VRRFAEAVARFDFTQAETAAQDALEPLRTGDLSRRGRRGR
jgi:hypothetical protein